MVGTALPERPRCGHASLWWKPRLYQELEGPTARSHWGQAAMGLRTTKCQLLVTSLCVMVSRQVWGNLCRTGGRQTVAFPIPARRGSGFPTFCFSRSEDKQSQLPELSSHPGWLSLVARVTPPLLIDFWFLRAVTPLQLFHNPAATLKEKGKVGADRMGGFQEKDICFCLLGAKEGGWTCCSHACRWEVGQLQVGSVRIGNCRASMEVYVRDLWICTTKRKQF